MNCTLSKVIIFAAGAAIGSAVTCKFWKDRYAKIAQAEIDEVTERFATIRAKKESETEQMAIEFHDVKPESKDVEKPYKPTPEEKVQYENYAARYSNQVKETPATEDPYVIPPEEFGEHPDYEQVSLTYYADGILADEWDNVIEDVDEVIGKGSLNRFGEYEDDSVFVRHDLLKTDYEILRDERDYLDVVGKVSSKLGGE